MSGLRAEVARAAGVPLDAPVEVDGDTGLGGPLAVSDLVTGAVAAQLVAARLLAGDQSLRDPRSAGVDRVFDKLLERRRRPFDHLARSDAVDQILGQAADLRHG